MGITNTPMKINNIMINIYVFSIIYNIHVNTYEVDNKEIYQVAKKNLKSFYVS